MKEGAKSLWAALGGARFASATSDKGSRGLSLVFRFTSHYLSFGFVFLK